MSLASESDKQPPRKRKRAFAPKVRTGCITCKTRRVKCDEAKPKCLRCTVGGYQCDGYLPAPARKQSPPQDECASNVAPTKIISSAVALGSWNGRQTVNLFYHSTAEKVLGFFHNDVFWKRYVLQLGFSEPAIGKALSALNAASVSSGRDRHLVDDQYLVQRYNEAIQLVLKRSTGFEADVIVTLVACVLFICIEFLKGDHKLGLSHIRSGLTILQELRTKASSCSSPASSPSSASSVTVQTEVEEALSLMFSRLHMHALLFEPSFAGFVGQLPSAQSPSKEPEVFNIGLARRLSADLHAEAMSFALAMSRKRYDPLGQTLEDLIRQMSFRSRFHDLRQSLNALLYGRQSASLTSQDKKIASIVLMQNITMSIVVATCLSADECCFDDFKADFEALVDIAEVVTGPDCSDLIRSVGSFQFDIGIIPPLFFTGSKCRFPALRRRCLKILGSTHWREGMFDSYRSYRTIQEIVRVEEQGLSGELPIESLRVHHYELGPIAVGATHQRLTLLLKPFGVFEEPVFRHLIITTDPELIPVEY